MERESTATLLLSCPDQKGLVASVSQFIYSNGGNIVYSDQHTDFEKNIFVMRIEWELEGFHVERGNINKLFGEIATRYNMSWELKFSDTVPRMAIMVSKYDHCLYDLLLRIHSQELNAEVPVIVSNHVDAKHIADSYKIPFEVFNLTPTNKSEVERKQLELFNNKKVDFIVLARYMQMLGADFIRKYPNKIINIHHSFLPAFSGSEPYRQAYARGVKIIGATSHFVTQELDAGPIIDQEVIRVSHRDTVQDMMRKGKDLERIVLAKAVRLYLENRILVYGNKTVVFD